MGENASQPEMGYEQAREELAEVVRKLESGGVPLADSMALSMPPLVAVAAVVAVGGAVSDAAVAGSMSSDDAAVEAAADEADVVDPVSRARPLSR